MGLQLQAISLWWGFDSIQMTGPRIFTSIQLHFLQVRTTNIWSAHTASMQMGLISQNPTASMACGLWTSDIQFTMGPNISGALVGLWPLASQNPRTPFSRPLASQMSAFGLQIYGPEQPRGYGPRLAQGVCWLLYPTPLVPGALCRIQSPRQSCGPIG